MEKIKHVTILKLNFFKKLINLSNFLTMKNILFVLFILQFLSCNLNKNEVEKKVIETSTKQPTEIINTINEKYISAESGLNFRDKPRGKILGKFEYAEKVQVISNTNVFETLNDKGETKEGEWLGLKHNNNTVYVFGAYLSDDKVADIIKEKTNLINILTPSGYRDWKDENDTDILNKKWIELHKKGDNYFLDKAKYKITRHEDQCAGGYYSAIETKRKTLLFIDKPNLKLGEVANIKINKDKLCPGEKNTFSYKNINYYIRAEGDIISEGKSSGDNGEIERSCEVKNYKLFISTDKTNEESLFLEESSFNDTFTQLLFVGDIDADGKLDFIFNASRDYEEERVVLYLSSYAKDNEIIKKVGDIAIQHDC